MLQKLSIPENVEEAVISKGADLMRAPTIAAIAAVVADAMTKAAAMPALCETSYYTHAHIMPTNAKFRPSAAAAATI